MAIALGPWLGVIRAEARRAGVEASTLAAIVYHESHGNPRAVYQERDGDCSVGLAQVKVKGCDAPRVAALMVPASNLRAAAKILRGTGRWCRRHRSDRHCRAGERVFAGGGAVNRYAGATSSFARELAPMRAVARRLVAKAGHR
jgi:soluble lytic murein transglycosylase-like protein